MFIRRTKTRTVGTQDHYFTFRLVKSVRIGDKVRQRTLLNLGAHFDLLPAQWPLLCQRLDDLLGGQSTLMDYPEEGREPRTTHRGAVDQSAGRNQPGRR